MHQPTRSSIALIQFRFRVHRSWQGTAIGAVRSVGTTQDGARPIVDSKGEAIAELMLEMAQCFFRIRAVGQKTGLITSWGGGAAPER